MSVVNPLTGRLIKVGGKTFNKVFNNQLGAGPMVKMSKEMLQQLSVPSASANLTSTDCAACALYFLGMFGKPMRRLVSYIIKHRIGVSDIHLQNLIREHENHIRRRKPHLILNDQGPTEIEFVSIPSASKIWSEKQYAKFYKKMCNYIYNTIPFGFATIFSYARNDQTGHIVVAARGKNGSYILLDVQSGFLIHSYSGQEIQNYFYDNYIVDFAKYSRGLMLKSVDTPLTGIKNHQRMAHKKKTIANITRQISVKN